MTLTCVIPTNRWVSLSCPRIWHITCIVLNCLFVTSCKRNLFVTGEIPYFCTKVKYHSLLYKNNHNFSFKKKFKKKSSLTGCHKSNRKQKNSNWKWIQNITDILTTVDTLFLLPMAFKKGLLLFWMQTESCVLEDKSKSPHAFCFLRM